MTKKRKIILGSILAVVILGMAGVVVARNGDKGVQVRTEEVGRRDLVSIVTASGIIQPQNKADISADISGRVVQLAVEEGQTVKEGDLLLRIDPSNYEAAVRRAEAAVAQAQAQQAQNEANLLHAQNAANRAEQLAQSDQLISSQELEQARTDLKVAQAQYKAAGFAVSQAQASLNEAQETLRKTTILAPMSGRVTRLNIRQGETAIVGTMNNPGSLLLTVADMSVMEASVNVDETDVPQIALGDSASVKIDAFPDQTFSGRVTRIGNSAIQGQGSTAGASSAEQAVDFEVLITLDDPPLTLRPDLSATADIVTATRKNALSVPIIAVTVRDSAGKKLTGTPVATTPGEPVAAPEADTVEVEGVFLARNGKAEFVPVTIGITGQQYFEVMDGLSGGETVVAGPYSVIRDLEDGNAIQAPTTPDGAAPADSAKEAT